MIEKQITDFYKEIGSPIEKLISKKPRGATEASVISAAEEVFDSGMYELIEIPREVLRRSIVIKKRDFVKEQKIRLDVEYWVNKYENLKTAYYVTVCLMVLILILVFNQWQVDHV